MKVSICHITSAHPRKDGRIFKRQCLTLASHNLETILVTCDGLPNEFIDGVNIQSYSDHKLSKRERFKLLFFNKRFVNYLLRIDAQVYQFHDIELMEVGKALKKKGKKVIFDSHENWPGYIESLLPKLRILRIIANNSILHYYRKTLPLFDAIFTVSPNLVEDLEVFSDKVLLIPNYPLLSEVAESNVKREHKNYFVYAGSVYQMSNQINIAKAISLIDSDVQYKIIGGINSEYKSQIQNEDIKNRIEFIPWVDKSVLNKLMANSLAGLVLLGYVPICCGRMGQLGSNKLFEYMAAGIPVICTDFVLWKEIIKKYKCGICVNPYNVGEIKNAMEYIVLNREDAIKMGENGRKAILNEYNWNLHIDKFLSCYLKLLNYNDN